MSKQNIYNSLIKMGMSHAGALGILGNFQAESGCEACRLQGDYELSRSRSKEYAAKVDSGEISKHVFSRDSMGWGLYQLTYWSRKEGFYDFCKNQNGSKSIADEEIQLKYMLKELREEYFDLYKFLCSTKEMYTATKRFCEEFERPAINNVQARYAMAQAIEAELNTDSEQITSDYWPPRVIDKNMSGCDVEVLQAVLKARGYAINNISGKFDNLLESETKKFQQENALVADGVVGPKTWAKLLQI